MLNKMLKIYKIWKNLSTIIIAIQILFIFCAMFYTHFINMLFNPKSFQGIIIILSPAIAYFIIGSICYIIIDKTGRDL